MNHILLITLAFFSIESANAAKVGPFTVDKKFCANVDTIAGVLNSFQQIQWPVVGMPGIVIGISQKTSVLLDMCKYIMQLEQLANAEKTFFVMDTLNTLTGNKWDEELNLARDTWTLANSVYDFNAGRERRGVDARRQIRDFAKFQRSLKTVQEKEVRRQEANNEIQKFAKAAARNAMLRDMLSCPKPNSSEVFSKVYADVVVPEEDRLERATANYTFYEQKLLEIGMTFLPTSSDFDQYKKDLQIIITDLYALEGSVRSQKKDNWVKTGEVDKLGVAIEVNQPVEDTYYEYRTVEKGNLFESMKKKYMSSWATFARRKWSQHYNVVAADRRVPEALNWGDVDRNREEEEIAGSREVRESPEISSIISDCNPQFFAYNNRNNMERADYNEQIAKDVVECKRATRVNEQAFVNAFSNFLDKLKDSLSEFQSATARIWTVESQYLNIDRLGSAKVDPFGEQTEVACTQGENLSMADLAKAQAEIQASSAVLLETIAANSIKQEERQKIEDERRVREEEEYGRMLRRIEASANAQSARQRQGVTLDVKTPGM